MRDIKFRAWDKKLKVWIVKGFHIFGETTLFDMIGCHCYETKGDGDSLERYNDIEVTQFTGLSDKKNTPIYEGDICLASSGVNGFIDFFNGRFCWTDGFCHWDLIYNKSDRQPGDDIVTKCKDLEIIGNIYENKKLLDMS